MFTAAIILALSAGYFGVFAVLIAGSTNDIESPMPFSSHESNRGKTRASAVHRNKKARR